MTSGVVEQCCQTSNLSLEHRAFHEGQSDLRDNHHASVAALIIGSQCIGALYVPGNNSEVEDQLWSELFKILDLSKNS